MVFPFIFTLYWVIPARFQRARNTFLLIVSYLLYLNWKPSFAIVLIFVTLTCYFGALIVERNADQQRRKSLCWIFGLLGIFPLLTFKYYNFVNNSITSLLDSIGLHFSLPGLNWAVPIGISFFSFQSVGYLLDVYHRRIEAEKNLADFALFVSFFPQVLCGPISTAKELMPQIKQTHTFNYEQGREGLQLLLWGMFLKLVLADRLGMFVDVAIERREFYSNLTCIEAVLMYTVQIYCDFAGYSLMAMGIAKALGFNLINNFRRPYLAASVSEFWRRWHISLSRWLSTHIYINLGGSRCSKPRQYFNTFITLVVSGLWHGANWTYVVWGACHGVMLVLEKIFCGKKLKQEFKAEKITPSVSRTIRILITFFFVSFVRIFFRLPTLGEGCQFIARLFSHYEGRDHELEDAGFLFSAIIFVFICEIIQEYYPGKISLFNNRFWIVRWSSYIAIVIVIFLYGSLDRGSFIYVAF